MKELAVHFPYWLKPEIIPGLPIRWYGLMYVVAFGITFLIFRREVRRRNFPMNDDDISGLFFWGILALLVGARVFATIVYETSDLYIREPWLIFWPFRNGRFTGLQGMSYHGGVIGFFIGVCAYCWARKRDAREVIDMLGCGIPLGYTFGRLGNFINGELYGRITAGPLGMIFPSAGISHRAPNFEAIKTWAEGQGLDVSGTLLNLPRHPSQLYEAFFEGIVLWLIIWMLKDRKPFKGFIIGVYVGGYGLFRFFIEYFREPDAELGYRLQLVPNNLPIEVAHPLTSISTGQILCVLQIIGALVWLIIASRLPDREPVLRYPDANESPPPKTDEERRAERVARRKLRNKLR